MVAIGRFCVRFALTSAILLTVYSKGLTAPANARQAVLQLDPVNTRIDYSLQGWPHVTHGTFQLARGIIRIDPVTGKAEGSVIVSATSGDSGSHMRDSEMKGSILEVGRYPEITFTPRQAEGQRAAQGEFPATIRGILMLHGSPHQIALTVVVQPSGDRFTATTHFAVPYVAWGLQGSKPSNLSLHRHGLYRYQNAGTGDVGPRRCAKAAPAHPDPASHDVKR